MKKYSKASGKIRVINGDIKNDIIVGDISSLTSCFNSIGDRVIDQQYYQTSYYECQWYRLYKSGWVEQGGSFIAGGGTSIVTFPIEMKDVNYMASGNFGNTSDASYAQCYNLTTTTMTMKTYNTTLIRWQVKGYIAK